MKTLWKRWSCRLRDSFSLKIAAGSAALVTVGALLWVLSPVDTGEAVASSNCAGIATEMCVDRSQGNTARFNSLLASASPACASKLQSFFAASDLPVDAMGCISEVSKLDGAGFWNS